MRTCGKTKLSNEQDATNSRENPQARKRANLYAKKCTTFEKECMARDRRNKRLRLVSPRRVVPESDCHLPSGGKSPPVAARRRNAISGKVKDRADRGGPRKGAPGRSYEPSDARDVPLLRTLIFRARRTELRRGVAVELAIRHETGLRLIRDESHRFMRGPRRVRPSKCK